MHCIFKDDANPIILRKAAGEKLHSKLYLQKDILLILLHIMIQAPTARGFPLSCIRPKSLRVVELLLYSSPSVLIPALRMVGNIVTGDDMQTQCIINHQALLCL
ncbi:Importin subunit alpha-1a [Vitis vinifera]|uniref:Importin subunit alpha-1a n=1 Tax=Vitis vinifera TaxID=29760 RepID=A0A438C4T2_VITVI|nr:Importin subunit alpha-1a [Vitis vinifera]